MRRPLIRLAILAIAFVVGATAPALATTVIPVSETDLAAQATVVVLGRVTGIGSHLDGTRGQIFTDITLAVDEVLAGPPLPASVTIRQPGGRAGSLAAWIEGSPEFVVGERVLVFLHAAHDGTLRVLHLYQGKFSVMVDPLTGDDVAIRTSGGGVRVLAPLRRTAAPPPKDTFRLADLRRAVRAARGRTAPPVPLQTAPDTGGAVVEQQDAFTFNGTTPARWFEPDAGQPIAISLNASGLPAAPGQGFDEARQAMAAWTGDPQSVFRYTDGGLTTAAGMRRDGVNAVSWNDPDEAMTNPVNCTGTLAIGGFFYSTTESDVVNGTTFMRILEGDAVVNNGWDGCGFYESALNLAEVLTHELGHVLGLGHSTDTTATMYANAHFDGRGASIESDDRAGLRFIYPLPALTLSFSAPADGATVSGSTTVSLAAAGGSGGYAYDVRLDGATLGSSATFTWNTAATANGAHTLTASVTDNEGHAASTSISVTVSNSTPPSGGTLLVSITQPANGATVSGVPWAVMWVEGQSGSANTFTLTLDGRTLGTTTTASRGPISMPYDTRTVANGSRLLTATVRDAAGNTGSATVTVTVSNAGAPPPLAVSITAPANGATVTGTITVSASASGGTTPYAYALAVDGAQVASGGSSSFSWNTATVGDGGHTLTMTVTDAASARAAASVSVTVSSGGTPPPPPPPTGTLQVFITSPGNGATLSGTNWVTLWLQGSSGTSNTYTLSVAGQTVATTTTASTGPVSIPWSTSAVADGAQTLTATARDATGNTGAASVAITVANGGTPPPPPPVLTAAFTSPAAGATVSGTVTIGMSASGGTTPYTYALAIDGAAVASGGSASYAWNTTTAAAGGHTLGLTVTDAAGHTATASRAVTVANGTPPSGGTVKVYLTSPPSGSTVSGTVWVNIWIEGAAAGTTTFTLRAGGTVVATTTDSGVHVTLPWNTAATPNGVTTLGATVLDAAGNTGTVSMPVTVAN